VLLAASGTRTLIDPTANPVPTTSTGQVDNDPSYPATKTEFKDAAMKPSGKKRIKVGQAKSN